MDPGGSSPAPPPNFPYPLSHREGGPRPPAFPPWVPYPVPPGRQGQTLTARLRPGFLITIPRITGAASRRRIPVSLLARHGMEAEYSS